MTHLSEEERQDLADGSLAGARAAAARAHVARCAACAADVAGLRAIVLRLHDDPAPNETDPDAWPSIRARIDARKMVPIAAPGAAPGPRFFARHGSWVAAAIIALAAAGVVVAMQLRVRPPAGAGAPVAGTEPRAPEAAAVMPASDSTRAYQAEVRQLLDEIELQRALLRPGTAAAADSDMHVIDQAIAELQAALVRDPNNPALRQLLAASYRQKRDLLERMKNAS